MTSRGVGGGDEFSGVTERERVSERRGGRLEASRLVWWRRWRWSGRGGRRLTVHPHFPSHLRLRVNLLVATAASPGRVQVESVVFYFIFLSCCRVQRGGKVLMKTAEEVDTGGVSAVEVDGDAFRLRGISGSG